MATKAPKKVAPPKFSSVRGTRIKKFVEKYIVVPEGKLVGQPMILLPEQTDFVHAVYDNVDSRGGLITRRGIFSIARKNGKSGLISALLAAHLIGPEARQNAQLYSAARSRDQAAVVFDYLAKSLRLRDDLEGLVQITDSSKKIKGLALNTEYKALSADATTAHGKSPILTIHDELGQVIGPKDALYDALETAGGAHDEPLSLIISTQAASDTDLLSTLIDDALFNPTPETVVRLYAAEKEADIYDESVWFRSNFALDKFRSLKEFAEAARRAKRMPSFENTFRNLYLNQRISLLSLFISPTVWRENDGAIDESLFTSGLPVHLALDLSQNKDLTAAVLSVKNPDDGKIHIKVYCYTPMMGLEERSVTDKFDYVTAAKSGHLIVLPGRVIDYGMVCQHLNTELEGMNIDSLHFDRWRIDLFKKAAADNEFLKTLHEDKWLPVGQGFKDMSPRVEFFEEQLLLENIRHGGHPLLNMAASNAVTVTDPAKNRKLEKAKSSARIDPLVAAVMSAYGFAEKIDAEDKPVVTENSLFFV